MRWEKPINKTKAELTQGWTKPWVVYQLAAQHFCSSFESILWDSPFYIFNVGNPSSCLIWVIYIYFIAQILRESICVNPQFGSLAHTHLCTTTPFFFPYLLISVLFYWFFHVSLLFAQSVRPPQADQSSCKPGSISAPNLPENPQALGGFQKDWMAKWGREVWDW